MIDNSSMKSSAPHDDVPASPARTWVGRILAGIVGLFLLLDGGMKIARAPIAVKMTSDLGYPETVVAPLGFVLVISTALFLIPRTSLLGAVLVCGYLGGAIATHVRTSGSLFEIVFPAIFGAMIWGSLCLRYPRVSSVIFGR